MLYRISAYLGLLLVIVLSGISFMWDAPAEFAITLIEKNVFLGATVFVFLMFAATVVAPVTMLPLVPLVSPAFGPFLTAVLSITGWTLGAVVAFLLARHAGRPLLAKFVSLEVLDKYERYLGDDTRFIGIVMLRLMIPVDILSYALGLFSRVPLLQYTFATMLGISYFSFVFAYLGDAAFSGDRLVFGSILICSILVLGLGAWYVVKKMHKGN